ncbi:amino acid permease/ SLC12A domain-containing protein [Mycena rosella]|uniref:Amino acid permease/ SLC12A domain-containing protein n=1 Tax=Mycena rosella TaxID=1033263 RepID=A0AAD7G829_MYCRO|nr:amino acid permease/ SLC12A domain-containing protein [Mycena rosella]
MGNPDGEDIKSIPENGHDSESQAVEVKSGLQRGLSARQVQMIAIAGTIGTGLFLGTGKSLVHGGPASLLIAYLIVGFIVYVTLILLGEMATQYPVAGSFTTYAGRFFSPSYSVALGYNYWLNDAISVAGDLTAAQLVLEFWNVKHPWIASLVFWVFLVSVNAFHVRSYGELEYWLATLKVVTIIIFIIVGILVNVGVNQQHSYIGAKNWHIEGAPFHNGFSGFVSVFVTASFAYGGTESLGITAGETKNPSRNMPRVVKFVFWRILIFYILAIFLIGLNVPWSYPNLSNGASATSPFTIVFTQIGSNVAGSFINTVVLTSVLSAGNHAMFAGTRVMYALATAEPPQAPRFFGKTTKNGVPLPALLLTSSISILCFGASFIGAGELWSWLQNLVGVSNQIAWFSIGLASFRFRRAWVAQGNSLNDLKFHARWTKYWGPPFVFLSTAFLILVQGYSSFTPEFVAVDFVSYYIEIPLMFVIVVGWTLYWRPWKTLGRPWYKFDIPDLKTLDLVSQQYEEGEEERMDDEKREARQRGKTGIFWRVYYLVA